MSAEREIAKKLRESRLIRESEFQLSGSTYKCAFGKYYRDNEQITRDEYFRAKDKISDTPVKKSYDNYEPEEFDTAIEDIESKIEDIRSDIGDVHPDDRDEYEDMLDEFSNNLNSMMDFLSEEQADRAKELMDDISRIKDTEYNGRVNTDPYTERGLRRSDFY